MVTIKQVVALNILQLLDVDLFVRRAGSAIGYAIGPSQSDRTSD
jgi:hypothetical protein